MKVRETEKRHIRRKYGYAALFVLRAEALCFVLTDYSSADCSRILGKLGGVNRDLQVILQGGAEDFKFSKSSAEEDVTSKV